MKKLWDNNCSYPHPTPHLWLNQVTFSAERNEDKKPGLPCTCRRHSRHFCHWGIPVPSVLDPHGLDPSQARPPIWARPSTKARPPPPGQTPLTRLDPSPRKDPSHPTGPEPPSPNMTWSHDGITWCTDQHTVCPCPGGSGYWGLKGSNHFF